MTDREILGWVRGEPIYVIKGAEPESGGEVEENDETEDDTENEGTGEEQTWTPPTQQEWEKVTKALAKANSEAKKKRLEAKGATKETDDAAQAAAAEAEKTWRPRLVRAEARAALVAAGAPADRVGKLLRLIDVDDVEIGDDGELDGLEGQIDEIKADYPELFSAPEERPRRAPRMNAADRSAPIRKSTSADLIASALTGRR